MSLAAELIHMGARLSQRLDETERRLAESEAARRQLAALVREARPYMMAENTGAGPIDAWLTAASDALDSEQTP